jgi:hypothetical protein
MNKEQSKSKEQEQNEWMELVHNGSGCAYEDPHKEEKQAFLRSLKKTSDKTEGISK